MWTFKDADIVMAYVRRSIMDPESHKTVYGPLEQHPIMDDLSMKYANQQVAEICHIWQLSQK